MKDIIYVGSSLKVITHFSSKAKQHIMALLDGLKEGINPHSTEFKYISIIGSGVYELRVKVSTLYRVFYVTKFKEGIYVLHAFVKKTQKTSKKDIEMGITRYKELMQYRSKEK